MHNFTNFYGKLISQSPKNQNHSRFGPPEMAVGSKIKNGARGGSEIDFFVPILVPSTPKLVHPEHIWPTKNLETLPQKRHTLSLSNIL